MKALIGYELLPWERLDESQAKSPNEILARGMREIKDAGFEAVEALSSTSLTYDYARRWMKFADLPSAPWVGTDMALMSRLSTLVRCSRETGLKLTTLFCDGEYINPATSDAEFDQAVTISLVSSAAGVRHLLVAGGPRRPEPRHQADLLQLASRLSEIGRACNEYGVQLCFHPHIDTCVETPHDIETFFNAADLDAVAFALDTAHVTAGGGDPARILRDNLDRVTYLHFKDVAMPPDPGPEFVGPARFAAFRDLGQGTVNFPQIVRILQDADFEGPIIAELDRTPDPGLSARISRQYLSDTLGI